MNRADEFCRRRSIRIILGSRSGCRRSIGVPTPFVGSGCGIEDNDAPVGVAAALAIGDVDFISNAIDRRLSWRTQGGRVVDSARLAAASDTQQERSGSRAFRHDVINLSR